MNFFKDIVEKIHFKQNKSLHLDKKGRWNQQSIQYIMNHMIHLQSEGINVSSCDCDADPEENIILAKPNRYDLQSKLYTLECTCCFRQTTYNFEPLLIIEEHMLNRIEELAEEEELTSDKKCDIINIHEWRKKHDIPDDGI